MCGSERTLSNAKSYCGVIDTHCRWSSDVTQRLRQILKKLSTREGSIPSYLWPRAVKIVWQTCLSYKRSLVLPSLHYAVARLPLSRWWTGIPLKSFWRNQVGSICVVVHMPHINPSGRNIWTLYACPSWFIYARISGVYTFVQRVEQDIDGSGLPLCCLIGSLSLGKDSSSGLWYTTVWPHETFFWGLLQIFYFVNRYSLLFALIGMCAIFYTHRGRLTLSLAL